MCYSLYSQCNGTKAVTNSLQLHCECKYFLSTMNDDPLTLRLNGVDNLDDWPAKRYATMWVRKHAKADAKMGKGNKGNRRSGTSGGSYGQLEDMEQEQYGDMVIKERPLKSMLGTWVL